MRRQNRKNGIFCLSDSHTIRPILNAVHRQNVPRDKRLKTTSPKGQNVPRDKMSQGTKRPKGQNVPRDKTFQGTNIPRDKTYQGQNVPRTKRPEGQNVGTDTVPVPVETANPHKTTWLSHCPISQESQHSNSVVYPNTLFWIQIQDFGPIWIRIRIQDYAFNF